MPQVLQYLRLNDSCPFDDAFVALRDPTAKARIDSTIRKLERGLLPDVKPVGEGVHEARIDYGPGYRVYFANDGTALIVLLLCGDKTTQASDIAQAKQFWNEYGARRTLSHPTDPLPPRRPRREKRRP
jgi:putative addiction module killer protein